LNGLLAPLFSSDKKIAHQTALVRVIQGRGRPLPPAEDGT
jgi:hypothetical protein